MSIINDLNSLESKIQENDILSDEQILEMKNRLKSIEKNLKEKSKPKTITISTSTHNKIKSYCNLYNHKIGEWVEATLLDSVKVLKAVDVYDKNEYKDVIDREKDEIINRFNRMNDRKFLVKTDKLILISGFKFVGISPIDHKPVYDYVKKTNDTKKEDFEKIKCEYKIVSESYLDNNQPGSYQKYIAEYADIELDVEFNDTVNGVIIEKPTVSIIDEEDELPFPKI